MSRLRKILLWLAGLTAFGYVSLCTAMYLGQEGLIFHPNKLDKNYTFNFDSRFEEVAVRASDSASISGLLFKADSAKGLVFYLHGNSGSVDGWASTAKLFTDLKYDCFILDYRGFGKSEGEINNEKQFFDDVQRAYNSFREKYSEDRITIIGYSLGTAPASMLASLNKPKRLILQAPFYSMIDMMHEMYPFIPDFLLKYKFETAKYLKETKAPITIFHGDADQVVYYGSSLKLKEVLKQGDRLITLKGQDHNNFRENQEYLKEISLLLQNP
jgi:uncharacterized protein